MGIWCLCLCRSVRRWECQCSDVCRWFLWVTVVSVVGLVEGKRGGEVVWGMLGQVRVH